MFLQSEELSVKSLSVFFKINLKEILFLLLPAVLVALLLNDPGAYLDGIVHPAQSYNLSSLCFWTDVLGSISFWEKALFNLLSPAVFFAWILSLSLLILGKDYGYFRRFILTWQLVTLSFFIFHREGLSGEHGLIIAIPPILLGVAFMLRKLNTSRWLFFVFMLSILPFTFFYGLFLVPLPYRPATYYANRTVGDTFYLNVIKRVNYLAKPNSNVFLLPQNEYPIFSLRKDLSWNYYEPQKSDVFVVSNPELLPKNANFSYIESMSGFEDGKVLSRYIFIKRL